MSQPSVSAYYSLRKRGTDQATAKTIKTVQDEATSCARKATRGAKIENWKPIEVAKVVVKGKSVAKSVESLALKSKNTSEKSNVHKVTPVDQVKNSSCTLSDNAQIKRKGAHDTPAALQHEDKSQKQTKKQPSPVTNTKDLEQPTRPSRVKKIPTPKELADIKTKGEKLVQNLTAPERTKLTPQEVKTKLGTVSKLCDLQSKLKLLTLTTAPKIMTSRRKALTEKTPNVPKLDPIKGENVKSPLQKVKAPLQKSEPASISNSTPPKICHYEAAPTAKNLTQPDKRLPLPKKYNFLAEVFDILDQIVSMKHNRLEMIKVNDVTLAVQNVLRKTFGEDYLKQIRHVFVRAYTYIWERVRDRMNRDTNNFELQMQTNPDYNQVVGSAMVGNGSKKIHHKVTPAVQVERLKLFKHFLLILVTDHHQAFLKANGIVIKASVKTWHKDFNLELLPDIALEDFPPKPHVDRVTTAQEMIQRLGPGVNPRLETVLKKCSVVEEAKSTPVQAQHKAVGEVKILKGLQGLSPQLLELVKAREKAKQIKTMTQDSQEQKEFEMMEELVMVAPYIMNCHRSQRNGAAVPADTLFKITSSSYGRKTAKEMEDLIRMFIRLVPECLEFKRYEKVEYIKQKKPSPDINQVREILEKLVLEKKKAGSIAEVVSLLP